MTRSVENAKEAIGKAWSKFFHIAGVPGRQADSPYFISADRETQKWGKFSFIAMIPMSLHSCSGAHAAVAGSDGARGVRFIGIHCTYK